MNDVTINRILLSDINHIIEHGRQQIMVIYTYWHIGRKNSIL